MAESTDQMVLTRSPVFIARLQYLMAQQARVVLAETGVGETHAARAAYAGSVLKTPSLVEGAAVLVVGGVNLIGTVVGSGATADSSAIDGAILAQVATFWNALAGVDTGN